jgi:hypothetical protein
MEQSKDNWKVTTMIIGGVVGLICGIVAAYILIQRAEEEESRPRISAGEGVKVGLGVLGLLRLVSDMPTKN